MFNIFVNGTLADATQVMQNFYHVGQEDRLPMGGSSLDPTTSVFDLGEDNYIWQNTFCNTLYVYDSISASNVWIQQGSIEVTTPTDRIEITGLNGDASNAFLIDVIFRTSTTGSSQLNMYINGDSSASYSYYRTAFSSGTSAGGVLSGQSTMIVCNQTFFDSGGSDRLSTARMKLSTKSGRTRIAHIEETNDIRPSVGGLDIKNYYTQYTWSNTTDTITSLVFKSSVSNAIGSLTTIKLVVFNDI